MESGMWCAWFVTWLAVFGFEVRRALFVFYFSSLLADGDWCGAGTPDGAWHPPFRYRSAHGTTIVDHTPHEGRGLTHARTHTAPTLTSPSPQRRVRKTYCDTPSGGALAPVWSKTVNLNANLRTL